MADDNWGAPMSEVLRPLQDLAAQINSALASLRPGGGQTMPATLARPMAAYAERLSELTTAWTESLRTTLEEQRKLADLMEGWAEQHKALSEQVAPWAAEHRRRTEEMATVVT